MCCLYGVIDYKRHFTQKQRIGVLTILSRACEVRGDDATGIAYNHGNKLSIYKRPLAAHCMRFEIPKSATTVMGHTRLTTQGDEKFNYNNHPFYGKTSREGFALAHNGVLYNDTSLRKSEHLPHTHIETDSYVAVQLIEKENALGFESLKAMAEKLMGSFTMTVLDQWNNLYFIKGDNPMCIYHYPKLGFYLYASTEEILKDAIQKMQYCFGDPERVVLREGDLLKIDAKGNRSYSRFEPSFFGSYYSYRPIRYLSLTGPEKRQEYQQEYIEHLKRHANFYGFTDEDVDALLANGYTTDDIEDLLYCGVI